MDGSSLREPRARQTPHLHREETMHVTARQKEATRRFMLRVAALKIQAHDLDDTPAEYVRKTQERAAPAPRRRP